jgi:hypothetical protein
MNKNKRWTETENSILTKLINQKTDILDIVKILNRTKASIECQKGKIGLSKKMDKRIKWTPDNVIILKKLVNEGKSFKNIANYFKVTRQSVTHVCSKHKIKLISAKNKKFNDNELEFIRENYIKNGTTFCAKKLNRPKQSIIHQANKMKIYSREYKNPEQSEYLNLIGIKFYNRIKKSAKARKIKFSLTPKYLWELFVKQEKKCNYSGIILFLPQNNENSKNRTASLDRIDSSKGYTEDNVQWIHKRINWLKCAFSEQEFFDWIEKIYNYKIKNYSFVGTKL